MAEDPSVDVDNPLSVLAYYMRPAMEEYEQEILRKHGLSGGGSTPKA